MGEQMTSEQAAFLEDLPTKWDRVERAILGDPSVGHIGLVNRMLTVEEAHTKIPEAHAVIEEHRITGDVRLGERLNAVEEETRDHLSTIEKKLDRSIWLTAGAFLGGMGAGLGISNLDPFL